MLFYGVCISDIKEINEEKAEEFFNALLATDARDIAENYFENKKDNGDDYTINEWSYNYFSEGRYGLSAVLKDIIRELEDVSIDCDDPDGVHYLGLYAGAPWEMTEKTRNMSKKEYDDILKKYLAHFTDQTLDIRWRGVEEDLYE